MLLPAPYADGHNGYITRYLETGEARIIGIGRDVTGAGKMPRCFRSGWRSAKRNIWGLFTGIIRDIRQRHKLQRDVLSIAEDEQRRLGQDLHDSAQQEVAGLGMLAQHRESSRESDTPADAQYPDFANSPRKF